MDYKRMYKNEKIRNDLLRERLQHQEDRNDEYYKYIQKQNVIIQLLKENIKELKGLK